MDAIFLDLAMPGIDGWTTLRQLRSQRLCAAPVAIVSANAFDQALDNDLDITPADFLVKPVRMAELLGWLERRLDLSWNFEPARQPEPSTRIDGVPGADDLAALADLVQLGYLRGIRARLVQIGATQAGCAGFVAQAQALAGAFALDSLATLIQQARSAPDTAHHESD